ncbi:putative KAP-like P-loop ATPase [Rhizobium tibeticum]|uniref:KAP family P-loop NTPase fold protein n=1 Tax=Rhizobium tibeticum TaxID=501024 RepID=UPI002788EBC3|nr:P-loop NTPase fold protein [Rhizobium tibeticum]MDP9812617.1 putative KAP-like P-loop ATPase [Rhizobium tibeticum]
MLQWINRLFKPTVNDPVAGIGEQGEVEASLSSGDEKPGQISLSGDSPIRLPEHDALGIDPFAQAIARSITAADAKDGLVYAINGTWGAGKSSAINLILHHLAGEAASGKIVATVFNPWWFSGSEALTISFFQELRATVGKSLDDKAREALATLGGRLSSAGPLLGGLASLAASPAAGAAVAGGASFLEKLTRLDSTVEKEHRKLADALSDQEAKFLIILDDIDRLGTDDALQVFKLIKSVGRLPNVIYLLAFDRHLAEKMVAERFPAEGATYLEKVIQGAFDLPNPDPDDLRSQLLTTAGDVMGAPPETKMQRFWNVFYDVVAPLIRTPRDVVRLSNTIKVSWPAVKENVDRADFLAIESLRLFVPEVHQAIRNHGNMLVGLQTDRNHNQQELKAEYESTFLDALPSRRREQVKIALRRLFPRLDSIWGNVWYSEERDWTKDRLVCSSSHFPTYFSFAVIDDGITAAESDALVANAGTPGATAAALRQFLQMPRRRKGGTRAALALAELRVRAADIHQDHVTQFLKDIFSVADELEVAADNRRGFGDYGSNDTRIHWLLNSLLLDRFDQATRTSLIRDATPAAGVAWLVSLSGRCKSIKDKRGTDKDRGDENFVDDETVDWLFDTSGDLIRAAAANGTLMNVPDIEGIIYDWRHRASDDEVRAWTDKQLENDAFVVKLAEAVIRQSWSYGVGGFGSLGDRVSRKYEYVNLKSLVPLLDIERFRGRVSTMLEDRGLEPLQRRALEKFQNAPEDDPGGRRGADD